MFTNLLTVILCCSPAVAYFSFFLLLFFSPSFLLSFFLSCVSILYFGGFGGYFLISVMLNRPRRPQWQRPLLSIRDGERRGGGGLPMNNSSSLCSVDPQRPKRPSATTRTDNKC